MDSTQWDARYAQTDLVWSAEPNQWVVQVAQDLPPGTVLDLGAGEARNALWLAEKGWQATAVDFSAVATERARALSDQHLGPNAERLTTITADLLTYRPDTSFDLVLVVYIHLQARYRRLVLGAAASAVAPGGLLLVVGHDRSNLTKGRGGPQDPAVLFTAQDVVEDLSTSGLDRLRAERVTRQVGDGSAVDALALFHRPR
jgi:SAM-dependent methyltransferase